MKKLGEILGLIAALIAISTALHAINNKISNISYFIQNPSHLVYLTLWLIVINVSLLLFMGIRVFYLMVPNDAKRLGIWMKWSETILDIQSDGESTNTMIRKFCIWHTVAHHLSFWSGPGPANSEREEPTIEVSGLPDGTAYNIDAEDIESRRHYNLYFSPPIDMTKGKAEIQIKIVEKTKNQYYLCQEDIPVGSTREFISEGYDYQRHRVVLPILTLKFTIIFPNGFIPIGRSYCDVHVSNTQTPVPRESKRLKRAVKLSVDGEGRRRLTAIIKKPITGASYILLWKPPKRKGIKT